MVKSGAQRYIFPIDTDNVRMENARNLPTRQLADTFIPTRLFWELLSVGHCILLGARGQGKTALFRMLAFEGLSALARTSSAIKQIVDSDKFIGIYFPTQLEWVQSLSLHVSNKSIDASKAFVWKLNHSICVAFLQTAKAYIQYHMTASAEAIMQEQKFCRELSDVWKLGQTEFTIDSVLKKLKRVGYEWQVNTSASLMGDYKWIGKSSCIYKEAFSVFSLGELKPLQVGIEVLAEVMNISSDANWLLCIDEAEYMTKDQQKVLNSLMRLTPGKLFLKVATMPFSHYTLDTDNPAAPVVPGHDFEYYNMEDGWGISSINDIGHTRLGELDSERLEFGNLLFRKVIKRYISDNDASKYSLEKFFGSCDLLDRQKETDWTADSHNMQLLRKYATSELIARAEKIQNKRDSEKFMDEVGRKIRGALVLRENSDICKGNSKSDVYSGASMIVKCADGNPRMLIRILSNMFAACKDFGKHPMKRKDQERVLTALAKNFLNQIRSYQNVGLMLHENVKTAGCYMRKELYQKPLASDCVFSIKIKEPNPEDLVRREQIQAAIKYGVLKPNDVSKINYGADATLEGKYHLAYIFCPLFRIQPRVGKAVSFQTMKDRLRGKSVVTKRVTRRKPTMANGQLLFDLFEEED